MTGIKDSPEVIARVSEGMTIVDAMARRLGHQFGSWANLDDLASQGRETLLSAARSFDPARGVPFKRWAMLRIRGAMMDAMRAQGSLPKRVYRKIRALEDADFIHEAAAEEDGAAPKRTAEEADAELSKRLGSAAMAMAIGLLKVRTDEAALERARDERESPESAVAHADLMARIRAAIEQRPDAERHLLIRHYFDDLTVEEAAREIGLSKSWASRLHARAIEAVTLAMREAKIEAD